MSNVPPVSATQRQGFLAALRAAGQAFDFTNGTTTLEGVLLIRSKPESNQVDASDLVAIESKEWDFLGDPEDFRDNDGNFVEPTDGCLITALDGTEYRVQPRGTFNKSWRWSDGQKTFIRISAIEQ